jgi:hypothetical protein
MKNRNGFATLTLLIMLGFLLLLTGIVWQSIQYIDQMAGANIREIETRNQINLICGWIAQLTKNRFDQIMGKLTISGRDIGMEMPLEILPKSGKCPLIFTKKSDSQIKVKGRAELIKGFRPRPFTCIVSKVPTQEPGKLDQYTLECSLDQPPNQNHI